MTINGTDEDQYFNDKKRRFKEVREGYASREPMRRLPTSYYRVQAIQHILHNMATI